MSENLPEGGESLLKLTAIELPVSVEVHSSEDDFESTETDSTLLLNGELELEVQLTHHHVLVHTVEGHRNRKLFLYLSSAWHHF